MNRFLVSGLIVLIFLSTACTTDGPVKDPYYAKEMDNVITEYLIERYHDPNVTNSNAFEVHDVYGTETKDDVTTIYIHSNFGVFRRHTVTLLSGHIVPAVVKIKNTGSSYEVIDYKEPKDGELYVESVKKLFPKRYANRILGENPRHGLHDELLIQVVKWNEKHKSDSKS